MMTIKKFADSALDFEIQKRRALMIMGIDVWVCRHAKTTFFDDKAEALNTALTSNNPVDMDNKTLLSGSDVPLNDNATSTIRSSINHKNTAPSYASSENTQVAAYDANNENEMAIDCIHTKADGDKKAVEASHFAQKKYLDDKNDLAQPKGLTPNQSQPKDVSLKDTPIKVAPFTLIGASYKAWVIMADMSVLNSPKVANLWRNMVQALSLTTQTIRFPLCTGIEDVDTANATLSGFIFSIGGRVDMQVALLTPIPEGLDDERLIRVPYLTEMIDNGQFKKQFWQLIR